MKKNIKIFLISTIVVCLVVGGFSYLNFHTITIPSDNLYGISESHWLFGSDENNILIFGYDGKEEGFGSNRRAIIRMNSNEDMLEIPIHYKPNKKINVQVSFNSFDFYDKDIQWNGSIKTDNNGDYLFKLNIPTNVVDCYDGEVKFFDGSDNENVIYIEFDDEYPIIYQKDYIFNANNSQYKLNNYWDNSLKWW